MKEGGSFDQDSVSVAKLGSPGSSSPNLHGSWTGRPEGNCTLGNVANLATLGKGCDMPGTISRRQLLAGSAGLGAVGVLAACSAGGTSPQSPTPSLPTSAPATGRVRTFALTARNSEIDLAGRVVATRTYGDALPGQALRATAGDRVRITVANELAEPTSIHWHGLAVPNAMDGVPGLTTPEIAAGGEFVFEFTLPDAGTHWFHPHHGAQVDSGLYAPFIVDDPADPGDYDAEWILVLDDWSDGLGPTLVQSYEALVEAGASGGGMHMDGMNMDGMDMGGGMGGMHMGGMSDGGDLDYSLYLINGHPPADPEVFEAKPGQRVRLRIINAAADSTFDVAVMGHRLDVTHADGFPVVPVSVDSLRVGMGERYDATLTLGDGVFPLVARRYGKPGMARALVRTGAGSVPPAEFTPPELDRGLLTVDMLTAAPGAALPESGPDIELDVALSGSMAPYVWTINGTTYDETTPLTVAAGQVARMRVSNHSMMAHPLHLHGHTWQVGAAGGVGCRKDTVLIPPMSATSLTLLADNPGQWALHCHTALHMEAGMMTRLDYAA